MSRGHSRVSTGSWWQQQSRGTPQAGEGSRVGLHGQAGGHAGSGQGLGLCRVWVCAGLWGLGLCRALGLSLHHPGHKARPGEKWEISASMCHSLVLFPDFLMLAAAKIGQMLPSHPLLRTVIALMSKDSVCLSSLPLQYFDSSIIFFSSTPFASGLCSERSLRPFII